MTANKGNYIVTQSAQFNATYSAWRIWNFVASATSGSGGEWAGNGTGSANQWVMIQLPYAVRTWRLDLSGRTVVTQYFTSWRFEGSNNGTTFTTLVTSTDSIDTTYRTYTFDSLIAYSFYRFYGITGTGGDNAGLTWFQLYALNVLQ